MFLKTFCSLYPPNFYLFPFICLTVKTLQMSRGMYLSNWETHGWAFFLQASNYQILQVFASGSASLEKKPLKIRLGCVHACMHVSVSVCACLHAWWRWQWLVAGKPESEQCGGGLRAGLEPPSSGDRHPPTPRFQHSSHSCLYGCGFPRASIPAIASRESHFPIAAAELGPLAGNVGLGRLLDGVLRLH